MSPSYTNSVSDTISFIHRNPVHQDTPVPSWGSKSVKLDTRSNPKSVKLDTRSKEHSDKTENVSYESNASYGLETRERDERTEETIMYEVMEDLPNQNQES